MEAAQPQRFTGTGDVHVGVGSLHGVVLTAGGDAASAVFRTGGASGTIILTLKAALGATTVFTPGVKLPFKDLHVTLTGTGPEVTVLL